MNTPKGAIPPPYRATTWEVLFWRALSLAVLGGVVYMVMTGHGYIPSKAGGRVHVTWHDDPMGFLVAIALYLYLAAGSWFYAPYHGWKRKTPDFNWPPRKPEFIGFYHPPFLKSLLLLAYSVGICFTLFGVYQFALGAVYEPGQDGIAQKVSAAADPAAFRSAMLGYLVIAVVTAVCIGIARVWHPADVLDSD